MVLCVYIILAMGNLGKHYENKNSTYKSTNRLGYMEDSIDIMINAIEYLKKHGEKNVINKL